MSDDIIVSEVARQALSVDGSLYRLEILWSPNLGSDVGYLVTRREFTPVDLATLQRREYRVDNMEEDSEESVLSVTGQDSSSDIENNNSDVESVTGQNSNVKTVMGQTTSLSIVNRASKSVAETKAQDVGKEHLAGGEGGGTLEENPFYTSAQVLEKATSVVKKRTSNAGTETKNLEVRILRMLKCDHCELYYATRSALTVHIKQHCDGISRNANVIIGRFPCSVCVKDYSSRKGLTRHVKEVHKNHVICCRDLNCEGKFARNENMESHYLKVHLQVDMTTFQCNECEKKYTRKRKMDIHYKRVHQHEGVNSVFECELCDKVYGAYRSFIIV